MARIIETKITVGAVSPFKIIHIADTHLTYADMRDNERKRELAAKRSQYFRGAEDTLSLASTLAGELSCPIFHTGDLSDFVSVANLDRVRAFISENDLTLSAGNHEFSQYVGEAKEDADYRNQSLEIVQAAYKNDIRMHTRIINGVKFIFLDDGYYKIEDEQLLFLKKELSEGLPSVIVMHTPLYEQELYLAMRRKHPCGYLLAVPDELVDTYERGRSQRADRPTSEAAEFIRNSPCVKAVISGHVHKDSENMLTDRILQITTDCETVRVIEFV
jgi:3',5'-cyclic AMP phosphodiesterase CpdA